MKCSVFPSHLLASVLLLIGLSGCVSDDAPKLAVEARQTYKLTAATVDFPPKAGVHISAVEDEVSARGGGKEQVAEAERAQIASVMPEEFMATVSPKLTGARPVVARIHVLSFNIPGPVETVLINGALGMAAGVDLVDVQTGEIVNSIPPGKISSAVFRPSGVIGFAVQAAEASNPSEKKTREMSHAFAAEYAVWLAK